ncbi:MAG: sigma 54-interacting transcriptional regulator [Chromatiales bacterium]|nr:sigma 54-interacting transcriptional regulator [Chromatiales bacterium]
MTIPGQTILLVDKDTKMIGLLSHRLSAAGYTVVTAESGKQALSEISAARPDLVITDLKVEGMDGIALMGAILERDPTLPVIILTAHGTIPTAVEATKKGAFNFLAKPFDSNELERLIDQALKMGGSGNNTGTQPNCRDWCHHIITRSPLMEDLLNQTKLAARSDVSILIQGESGTGKELLAEAIQKVSPRSDSPFKVINCSAIPENLLESELFGHRKGAFTGADSHHTGLFQAADGGLLFLDEIGDMPLNLQAKLLRALQEKRVRPVGSTETVPIDVQVISATHRNLQQAMVEGKFRQDLFYRLNVVMLTIPPLRNRREDIPSLANHFLSRIAAHRNQKQKSFSAEAMELLVNFSWPGNVRQLNNLVEQTTVLAPSDIIPATLVEKALQERPKRLLSYTEAKSQFERNYLAQVLQIARGNVSKAAQLANRNRTEFYRLLNRNQLEPARFRRIGK